MEDLSIARAGWPAFRDTRNHAGLFWGITTGCVIAGYTLVDGYSVKVLLLSPILVEYAGNRSGLWFCLSGLIVAVLRCGRNMRSIGRKH